MWRLKMTNEAGEWIVENHYPDLTTVTKRIIELDEASTNGIFYNIHVLGSLPTADDEALSELEYDGRKALFRVKRVRH